MAKIRNAADTDTADVDNTPEALRTSLRTTAGSVLRPKNSPSGGGSVVIGGLNDGSAVAASAGRAGSLAESRYTILLHDSFEGGGSYVINPLTWLVNATTMTSGLNTGGIAFVGYVMNATMINTGATGVLVTSLRRFRIMQRTVLQARFRARVSHQANTLAELGFGDATALVTAHTAGAYWQFTPRGEVVPIVTFNSSDFGRGTDIRPLMQYDRFYTYDVLIGDDSVVFICQDSSSGVIISRQVIRLSAYSQRLLSSSQISAFARLYNFAQTSQPSVMVISDVLVLLHGADTSQSYADQMGGANRSVQSVPFTGVGNATWANGGEPASATLSNTAAGYAVLAGKFQFAAPAGAVTDFALFGLATPTPANLVITGGIIDVWNVGAVSSASVPTLLQWFLGHKSTAVSLATASVVRIPFGVQVMPVSAPIGLSLTRLEKSYRTGFMIPANRFLHLGLRIPVGAATASQVIAGAFSLDGYYE